LYFAHGRGSNGVSTHKIPSYLIHNHPTTFRPFLKILRYKTAQILTFNPMSESRSIHIDYQVVSQLADLTKDDQSLLNQAIEASKLAYAPYSKFHVGCALRLANGKVINGSNQENAAYTVCQCAERGALGYASAKYPDVAVIEVAVYARGASVTTPVATPCGVCRQALLEYADRFDQTMRIIAQCNNSSIYLFNSIRDLLPLGFSKSNLI